VIVSFALIEVRSADEALERSRRFWKIAGDGEDDIRQVFGPVGGSDARYRHRGGSPRDRGVWRLESARMMAGLAKLVRDVGLAQDALITAPGAVIRPGIPAGSDPAGQVFTASGLEVANSMVQAIRAVINPGRAR